MPAAAAGSRIAALALLALIVAAGAGLRLYRLDFQSLWNDELSSWRRSSYETLGEVVARAADDVHPPGHHAVLWAVQRWLGDSERHLRLPSAVFGTLTIVFVYLVGRRLYSEGEGLIAAGLTAMLWCPIFYSQEARMYALLSLTTVAATYFWIGLLEEARGGPPAGWAERAAYVATAAAACYSHYFGVLVVGLQALGLGAAALRRRRGLAANALTYALIGVVYLPWLGPTLADFAGEETGRQPPGAEALASYAGFLFNRSTLMTGTAALCLLALLVRTTVWRSAGEERPGWRRLLASPGALLTAWLLLPVLLTFALSWIGEPMFVNRYLIVSMPAAYLLLARSFTRLAPARWVAVAAALVFHAYALYHLLGPLQYYTKPRKTQFREAVAHVVARDAEVADSLLVGYAWSPRYFDYYFERLGSERRVDLNAGTEADLERLLAKVARRAPLHLWFVSAHRIPDPGFLAALAERFELLEHREYRGADARLYAVAARPLTAAEPAPSKPFEPAPPVRQDYTPEIGGRVAIEAEDFTGQKGGSGRDSRSLWWVVTDDAVGGGRFVDAQPNVGVSTGDRLTGARLDYLIDFTTTGTYWVWLRMQGRGGADNSVHVGLDGRGATLAGRGISHRGEGWTWRSEVAGAPAGAERARVEVEAPGLHYFNLWVREDGTAVDQILLLSDPEVEPSGIVQTLAPQAVPSRP